MMRTTLNLPDDIYEVARSVAASKQISLGEAVVELVRRGLNPRPLSKTDAIFPHFSVPSEAVLITLEKALEAEDEI